MDSIVHDVTAIQAAFVTQETLVLLVNIFENGTEAVWVIDCVPESRSVNYR